MIDGNKVPLVKTSLLKYYHLASISNDNSSKRRKREPFHRDEFVQCALCKKERRFRIQILEECRAYHDAKENKKWTCSDWRFSK